MKGFKIDFEKRVTEINLYFEFVRYIDKIETHKKQIIKTDDDIKFQPKRDLQKILRSNCFLLLYNIIEASIRNSIIAVYDNIHDENLNFEDLSERLQEVWLSYKSRQIQLQEKKIKITIKELINDVSIENSIHLSKDTIQISGNLDYENINKIINTYGFFGRLTIDKNDLKKALDKIKKERNLLAHGNKTFCQSGEIITINELENYKIIIIDFLKELLDNIETYIDNKKYKKQTNNR